MSLLVDVQMVPNKILELVKARILANRAKARNNQQVAQLKGPTRPRVQRAKFGADSLTYRRPEPAATTGRDAAIFIAFVNTTGEQSGNMGLYINNPEELIPGNTKSPDIAGKAVGLPKLALSVFITEQGRKVIDNIAKSINGASEWELLLKTAAGKSLNALYPSETYELTGIEDIPELPQSRKPRYGKRNMLRLKQTSVPGPSGSFEIVTGSLSIPRLTVRTINWTGIEAVGALTDIWFSPGFWNLSESPEEKDLLARGCKPFFLILFNEMVPGWNFYSPPIKGEYYTGWDCPLSGPKPEVGYELTFYTRFAGEPPMDS